MAMDYAKVLQNLKVTFEVIGRKDSSASIFEEKTGIRVHRGGLEKYLLQHPTIPTHAIIAVGIEQLSETTKLLLNYNIKNILLEKPGALTLKELVKNEKLAKEKDAQIYIAYNRRFYSSVYKAQEIIIEDGGVSSFHFEFTEWSHIIEQLTKAPGVKECWFIGNSTHVIDTAFFLGGFPKELSSYITNKLSWHNPAIFVGAGKSDNGALFSYCANWQAPGRWSVEILTKKHRLHLKPMEELQIQDIGSIAINPVLLNNHYDKEFKPGIYLQTKTFLDCKDMSRFCTIKEQKEKWNKFYLKMNGYKNE